LLLTNDSLTVAGVSITRGNASVVFVDSVQDDDDPSFTPNDDSYGLPLFPVVGGGGIAVVWAPNAALKVALFEDVVWVGNTATITVAGAGDSAVSFGGGGLSVTGGGNGCAVTIQGCAAGTLLCLAIFAFPSETHTLASYSKRQAIEACIHSVLPRGRSHVLFQVVNQNAIGCHDDVRLVCVCVVLGTPFCVAVNNSVLGVVLNENVAFGGLALLGGGMFVHVGDGVSPMADVQITLASVTSSGNAIVNGKLWRPFNRGGGGGIMAVISSGSTLTASGISLNQVNVCNNTGTCSMICALLVGCVDIE
jgi:hypothetical protein